MAEKSTHKNTDRNPRKMENLRPPWKPGESGNPKGRPTKEECITSLVKEILEQKAPGDKRKRTWKQLVAEALIREAIKGKAQNIKELLDRVEGKVPQPLTGDDGNPLFPENPYHGLSKEEIVEELSRRGYSRK